MPSPGGRAHESAAQEIKRPASSSGVVAACASNLRTLDAVHLATALEFGADLDAFVCYDRRLLAAATAQGIPVTSPGSR